MMVAQIGFISFFFFLLIAPPDYKKEIRYLLALYFHWDAMSRI